MSKNVKCFSIIVVLLTCFIAAAQATDMYWVSFGGAGFGDSKFLMQIDQNGNITKDPCEVVMGSQFGNLPGATALGKNGIKLTMWMVGGFRPPGYWVYRATINKSNCAVTSFIKTNIWTSDWSFLQASQIDTGNFLTIERPKPSGGGGNSPMFFDNGVLWAAAVTKSGQGTGDLWRLSPRTQYSNDVGGVAPDAMMALSNDHDSPPDKLYTQALNRHGLPTQIDPFVITNYDGTDLDFQSVDVSNPMANGRRFAVYTSGFGRQTGAAGGAPVGAADVIVQQINGVTGDKIQSPRTINSSFRGGFLQTVAVDPKGRFVLFTLGVGPFARPQNGICGFGDELLYQALDGTGHAAGDPISLVDGCTLGLFGIQGIDILQE